MPDGKPSVQGIEEIVFEVHDLERSISFYRDVIGLPLLSRNSQEAWFSVGRQTLALFTRERVGSGQHFAFRLATEDGEKARRHLIAQGFQPERRQLEGGESLYVKDPDGNKIELYPKGTDL